MVQKEKICSSCGILKKLFSKGRCQSCARREDTKPLKRMEIKKKPYSIPKQTQKNKDARKEQSIIRNVFFEHHIPKCKFSEEDGCLIHKASRVNICHLFYKRVYKSVQANINNFVYLTWPQHTRFDQLLDSNDFEQLEKEFKCWPVVVERMKHLLPQVEENGNMKILFEEYLEFKD